MRHHGCVISAIKLIMKTFLLELEPVLLVYRLYINLSVNAICIKSFSTVCDVDNLCFNVMNGLLFIDPPCIIYIIA